MRRSDDSSPLLSICLTCRDGREEACGDVRGGARLAEAVLAKAAGDGRPALGLRGVRCMSQCKRACTIALSGPGRFTDLFGDLDPTRHVADVLSLAAYAEAEDGFLPRPERPEVMHVGVLSRIPPLGFEGDLVELLACPPLDPSKEIEGP